MRAISLFLLLFMLSGCVGVITKREYTYQEMYQVGKFTFYGLSFIYKFKGGENEKVDINNTCNYSY